jgi:signal transduction histidine kinase
MLVRPSPKIETVVYSIVREAINNVRRHARAANVWLKVNRDTARDQLVVTIEDDGRGFDLNAVQQNYGERGSIGLLSMRERAEMVGGTLTVESTIGRGTRVSLVVPLYADDDQPAPLNSPDASYPLSHS